MYLANMPYDITDHYLCNMLNDKGYNPVYIRMVCN